jgi:hypothetical protein
MSNEQKLLYEKKIPLSRIILAGVYPEFGGRDAQHPKNQRVKAFHKWAGQFSALDCSKEAR